MQKNKEHLSRKPTLNKNDFNWCLKWSADLIKCRYVGSLFQMCGPITAKELSTISKILRVYGELQQIWARLSWLWQQTAWWGRPNRMVHLQPSNNGPACTVCTQCAEWLADSDGSVAKQCYDHVTMNQRQVVRLYSEPTAGVECHRLEDWQTRRYSSPVRYALGLWWECSNSNKGQGFTAP